MLTSHVGDGVIAGVLAVPRYHFNVYDGIDAPDEDGTDLRGLLEAKREAMRLSVELLQQSMEHLDQDEGWHLEVTDDTGLVLYRIDFNITETAATQQFDCVS